MVRKARTFINCGVSLSCVAAVAVAGCGSKGILGRWTTQVKTPGEKPTTILLNLNADGTMTQSTQTMGHIVVGKYSYIVKDNVITGTLIGGTFDGKVLHVNDTLKPTMNYAFKIEGDSLKLNSALWGGVLSFKRVD